MRTPALLLDRDRLVGNIDRMHRHVASLGVSLRPHMKTAKCRQVAELAAPEHGPITVSTLAEARCFADAGYRDIIYAVGLAPAKLDAVAGMRAAGADLQVIVDNRAAAGEVVEMDTALRPGVWIEIDVDGRRAGVEPDDPEVLRIARLLDEAGTLRGVLTHGGGAYGCVGDAARAAFVEHERSAVCHAADTIRADGLECAGVSLGSTPGVTAATGLDGVTEVRPGVYMFGDLFQAGVGACALGDIAISVLTTVIGRRRDGRLVLDAGGLALSLDRSTASLPDDCGYGLIADETGRIVPGVMVERVSQEHGVTSPASDTTLAVGDRLRVLPNHACMTAAGHEWYEVISGGDVVDRWRRCNGW